jgi:hypothetical protein
MDKFMVPESPEVLEELDIENMHAQDMLPEIPFKERIKAHAERLDFDESLSTRQRAFLKCYSIWPSITYASRVSKVTANKHYIWLNNPIYAEAFQEASQAAAEFMEDEAWRRAIQGWLEPVYQKGMLVGHVRKYDGNLHRLLLQANMRGKYGDKIQVEGTGQPLVRVVLRKDHDDDE